jgi:hypothetical protein
MPTVEIEGSTYCHVLKGVILDGVLDWILGLMTTYEHNSELQVITAPSLIYTNYKSLQHTLRFSSLLYIPQPFPGNGF